MFFALSFSASLQAETGLSDEALLDTIQRQTFEFFAREVNPKNGLIPDRAHNQRRGSTRAPASIAAVGFALTAYPVGVERGWMDYATAYELTRRTLYSFLHDIPHEHGFFYHFLNMTTGERAGKSELSPIDTALFLAGALFAAEYFDKPEVRELAQAIYERVDFEWMLNKGKTLAMAWSPESGFSPRRWDHYDESMILYLLAIGSPTHPIPAESWKEIQRPVGEYGGYRVIQMPPLFTHQYSHIWIDFRDKNDGYADYFQNSVNATLANRAFCIDQASKFSSYGPHSWGLTASDGPSGYKAYGAPPGWAQHDGTVAPTACGSSIVFTPEESKACLRYFYEELGDKIWGNYGFSDAFNLHRNWVAQDVIGIDQGPLVAMIENYRSELIWQKMAHQENLQEAMRKVGFRPGTKDIPWAEPPVFSAPYVFGGIRVDGYLRDWASADAILLGPEHIEAGHVSNAEDLSAQIRFAWDENALYFSAKVIDDSLVLRRSGRHLWQDDALELYIDPAGNGFYWENTKDFQMGFRASEEGLAEGWSWFQGGEPMNEPDKGMAASVVDAQSYVLEGSIRWHHLGVTPHAGQHLNLSVAVHDRDLDRSEGKLHWFFRNEGGLGRFQLGQITLEKST